MSATPNASATVNGTANEPSQKIGTAAATKAPNPARPSKFAGLNLRQRSGEHPAVESEPTRVPQASPEEHDPQPQQTASSIPTDLDRAPETPAAGAADLASDTVPAWRQPSVASAPTTEAIGSSSAPHLVSEASSSDTEQVARPSEQRQQSATSQPLASMQRNGRSRPEAAGVEQAPTRRRGKRTDPEYVQVTAYVRQETYRRARIKLLESTKPQEFSEVVEELLTRWLHASS